MTVTETILVYGGIPLALILVVALLTSFGGKDRAARYKPGAPWEHPDIWWQPHPEPGAHGSGHAGELVTGHGETPHGTGTSIGSPRTGARALGQAPQHGSSVDLGTGPRRTAAGGARGTW